MTTATKTHYVFVYGSLKTGFSNNRVLTDTANWNGGSVGVKYGQGITLRQDFTMFSLGGFPGVASGGGTQAIWGEVWEIDSPKLERLDQMERVPHMYNRIEVDVVLDDGELVKAYMYVMSDEMAKRTAEHDEWKRKNPPTYKITWPEAKVDILCIDDVSVANWIDPYVRGE